MLHFTSPRMSMSKLLKIEDQRTKSADEATLKAIMVLGRELDSAAWCLGKAFIALLSG